jgi:hypothetical protein
MSQQQGLSSLADFFKLFSKTATGSNTAVYTVPTANEGAVPPVLPTTAIVKSIRLANVSGGAVTTTVTVLDYDASSPLEIELFKNSLADGATQEVLSQPLTLEQQDAIKIVGNGVKIAVSLMEIT